MARKYGQCPKCGEEKPLTKHHVFPRRHFGNKKNLRRYKLLLCRLCHNDIERAIPFEEMPLSFYPAVCAAFLYQPEYSIV